MKLVKAAALAKLFGVSGPAIARAVREGRLTYQDGARKLFDEAVAKIQWTANRRRKRVPVKPAGNGDDATAGPTHADALQSARLRREEALAHRDELLTAKLAGTLLDREEVARLYGDFLTTLRDRLLTNAALVLAIRHAKTDDLAQRVYADEMRAVLHRFGTIANGEAKGGDE